MSFNSFKFLHRTVENCSSNPLIKSNFSILQVHTHVHDAVQHVVFMLYYVLLCVLLLHLFVTINDK